MKKIFILLIAIIMIMPSTIYANDGDFTPNAKSSILMDYDTKEVLYKKNENQRISVASLTKMMGLIIIFEKIEEGSLKTNEILTVSKNAKEMGGTQIWLEEGEKIKVDDLLKGVIMTSANDAMVQLAERVSGTENAFVKKMNEKAKDLGLKNTNFKNSTGFDEEGAYSSAYDMALIACELLKHEEVLKYSSKYEDYIRENTDNKTWVVNTNKLVNYYKGADGLKTGYTDDAGSSIAATAKKDGLRLIAISFGYKDTKTRNNETVALLDYGFSMYSSKTVLKKGKVIKKISLNKADKNKINLVLKEDAKVTTKLGAKEKNYTYSIKLNDITYPIKKGDTIGILYLIDNENIIKTIDLVTDTDIKKAGLIKQYFNVLKDLFSGSVL